MLLDKKVLKIKRKKIRNR